MAGVWDRLGPRARQVLVVATTLAAVAAIVLPFTTNESAVTPRTRADKADAARLRNILTPADPRQLGMSGLARELESLKRARSETSAPATIEVAAPPSAETAELRSTLATLQAELAQIRAETRERATPAAAGSAHGAGPGAVAAPPPRATPALRIRTVDADDGAESRPAATTAAAGSGAATADPPKVAGFYLPSGSLLTGVLIYGLEAATGRQASADPQPVLVRLKTEAILPSRWQADVCECHVMAACFGTLAAERAYCRSTAISCIAEDGTAFDAEVQMVAVGSDGKLGLVGRVVSKQGAALRNATLAGFAEGAARALGGSGGTSIGLGGGFNPGSVLQSGGAVGAGSALDRVAQFYIEQAAETQPVIEIDGGREISFATVRGATLSLAGAHGSAPPRR
jgi:conjugal transfer pilus assembly protein TraB